MPAEGQTATGPNGQRAVYRGGQWVVAPVSMPSAIPGAFVPPNPARVAEKQRDQARQDAADAREAARLRIAQQEEARAQQKFAQEDTVSPPPGDTSKTGDEYLATLPTALAGQVKALSEGRRAFPTGSALRSPQVQELIAAATQYDPSLDATNAATRVATRKDFTSGKSAANITALNTVIGHLGSLARSAGDLHNRGLKPWNSLANAAEAGTVGFPALKGFNLSRQAVSDEMERVWRQAGGNVSEIQAWRESFDSSSTPEEFQTAISKSMELLNSRLEALGAQYQQGMGQSKDPLTFLKPTAQAIYQHLGPGGDGVVPGPGSAPPPPLSGGPPGGNPPSPFDGGGAAPASTPATGATKNVYDAKTAAGFNALVQRGRPYAEVAAYAQANNAPPPSPGEYAAATAWQKAHPGTPYNATNISHTEPTTTAERLSATPEWAALGGAVDAYTGGFNDELAGGLGALQGKDYTQARDAANADKQIMGEMHPVATVAGNVVGGAGAALTGEAALARFAPGALAPIARTLGKFATPVSDATYGAIYGAGENNDDRTMGAIENGLLAPVVGKVARSTTKGLANIISPPAGAFGPTYGQGVFPTIGQRFGKSGLAGRIINTGEQALQSVPLLGSMVARARQIPRNAYQVGAFDDALAEIGQQLPPGTGPGTDAHAYASKAFSGAYDQARTGMQFLPDQIYADEAQKFASGLENGTLDDTQQGQVLQRINTAVNSRLSATGGALPGEAYKAAASDLAETQRQWAKTDPLKANAVGDYLTIFDNAARRNSDPQAVQMLDQADRGFAKLVRIQRASELGGVGKEDGTFTPNNLSTAVKQAAGGVRSGPYLRGNALSQDYANAGRGLSDTLPNSGTSERLMTGQLAVGGAGALAGAPAAIAAHPGALAPFALYAPGINKAVTRAIAPRSATLPPNLAAPLIALAAQIEKRAPIAGRLAVPAALQWWGAQP